MKPAIKLEREEAAAGGLARVFCVRAGDGRLWAEKQLLPKFQGRLEFENFQKREFEILSRLNHPRVPKALQLRMESPRPGVITHILELSWVEGVALSEWMPSFSEMKATERLDVGRAILRQLIDIFQHLDERGVIHGDLTPDNVLLSQEGEVSLVDFGASRLKQEIEVSSSFRIAGKPSFRAPEVRSSGGSSREADLYSLGRIYEEIVGVENLERTEVAAEVRCMMDERCLLDMSRLSAFPQRMQLPALANRCSLEPRISSEYKTLMMLQAPAPWRRVALIVLSAMSLSTFQSVASLQVNSLPFMEVKFPNLSEEKWETPILNMRLPAGKVLMEFSVAGDKSKIIHREAELKAGQMLKFFEDFRNTDSL